jgi:phosphoribosyl-ATP pyrophosphohydrolase
MAELYNIIEQRKIHADEGSYTAYLFKSGLDKILKKVGEECAETIIAAKNGSKEEVVNETSDLLYHLLVMHCDMGIDIKEVENNLEQRRKKSGNLKTINVTDKNS